MVLRGVVRGAGREVVGALHLELGDVDIEAEAVVALCVTGRAGLSLAVEQAHTVAVSDRPLCRHLTDHGNNGTLPGSLKVAHPKAKSVHALKNAMTRVCWILCQ